MIMGLSCSANILYLKDHGSDALGLDALGQNSASAPAIQNHTFWDTESQKQEQSPANAESPGTQNHVLGCGK